MPHNAIVRTVSKVLKEYVRLLVEDEYGGFDITASNVDSPGGASFGSGKDLYNVFVKPFVDVVDTTVGKTKELSQRAQTLAKVAFESIATTLIPTLEDDYESLFEREKANLDKLKSQYGAVYDATWDAFKENDVLAAAFFYDPSMMLTAKIAQQAPVQTVKLLNVLTGGNLDGFLQKVIKRFKLGHRSSSRGEGPGLPEGRIIKEEADIGTVLSQKKIKAAINDSAKTESMRSAAKQVTDQTLNAISQRIDAIRSATSIDSLNSKLNTKIDVKELSKLSQQDRANVERAAIQAAKKSALSLYERGLKQRLKTLRDAGVPDGHGYVVAIKKVLSKVSAA